MLANILGQACFVYMLYIMFTDKFRLHEKYDEIPKLFELDDYESCMQNDDALFCTVRVQFSPQPGLPFLEIWNTIQEVNADTRAYLRHDILYRGVCASSRCNLSKELYVDNIMQDAVVTSKLEECVSVELSDKYKLSASVEIETCKYHKHQTISAKQWIYLAAVGGLILFSLLGCFVEKQDSHNSLLNRFLLAFSLRENWATLMRRTIKHEVDNNNITSSKYLYGVQGLKTMVMMIVILVHILFFIINSYTDNLELVEMMFGSDTAMLFYNGAVIMQIFLCISGFLLAYHFLKYAEKHHNVGFRQYPKFILQRWLRFTPVNIFTIGYIVLWSARIDGDYPRLNITAIEELTCSHSWWNNLLFINNRNHEAFKCMPHTWYLAVDMQLYFVMIFLLIVIWKLKHLAKYILTGSLLLSVAILSYRTYVNGYGPILIVTPQIMRTVFDTCREFHEVYIQAYSNAIAYIIGMIAAFYLYYRTKEELVQLHNNKWLQLQSTSITPVTVMWSVVSGSFIAGHGGVLAALYISLIKVIVASMVAIFLVAIATSTPYYGKSFLESRIMLFLGSLNFSALMIHLVVQKYLTSSMQMFHINIFTVMKFSIQSIVVTYALAIPVFLIIEMPFSNLQKMLFNTASYHHKENGFIKKDG